MKSKTTNNKIPLRGMTIEWLAGECEAPADLLWKLARDTSLMYKPTRPQLKEGGGHRDIDPPKKEFRRLLRRINKVLTNNIKHHPAAHGGVPGRSSFTSARRHCGAKYIVTRDIKNCYPSITPKQLYSSFIRLGASPEFGKFLSSIVTVHNRIPQGGHCSSLALNLHLQLMDDHFYRKAENRRCKYGRLADDFVISGNCREKAFALGRELDNSVTQRHLQINEKKRRDKGFLDGDKLKDIHSLIVNSPRGLKPKKEHIQKALHFAEKYARCCRCARPEDLPHIADLRQRITGWMYYFRQAEFSPARHIRLMIERGDKIVLRMLLNNCLQPYKNKWWLVHPGRNEPRRLLCIWENKIELSHTYN